MRKGREEREGGKEGRREGAREGGRKGVREGKEGGKERWMDGGDGMECICIIDNCLTYYFPTFLTLLTSTDAMYLRLLRSSSTNVSSELRSLRRMRESTMRKKTSTDWPVSMLRKERDWGTDSQTDRQTHRQTRQTYSQTDRWRREIGWLSVTFSPVPTIDKILKN